MTIFRISELSSPKHLAGSRSAFREKRLGLVACDALDVQEDHRPSIALSEDLFGLLAGVLAASLLMVFAILGFAVLHAVTRGMRSRVIALIAAYAGVIVFGWPILGMALLGIADTAFNFRGRAAPTGGPPSPRT